MKIITINTINTIINHLAHHLLCVFCAFEAQVPENVIHKMQHLLVEEIKICYFLRIILVLAPGKDCITARRQVMANTSTLLTLRLLLSKAGRGCRAGLLSNEQQNFIMRDEFLYIANLKARPGPPLVTGSVRHASRAAGAAVKHLLHSHLSAGTGSR